MKRVLWMRRKLRDIRVGDVVVSRSRAWFVLGTTLGYRRGDPVVTLYMVEVAAPVDPEEDRYEHPWERIEVRTASPGVDMRVACPEVFSDNAARFYVHKDWLVDNYEDAEQLAQRFAEAKRLHENKEAEGVRR